MPLSSSARFCTQHFLLWLVFNFQIKRRTELHTSLNHHFTTAFWQSRGPKSPSHSKHLDASTILLPRAACLCLPWLWNCERMIWVIFLADLILWLPGWMPPKLLKKLISNLSEKIAEKVNFWSTIPRCLIAGVMDVLGCRNSKDANYFLSGHQKKHHYFFTNSSSSHVEAS